MHSICSCTHDGLECVAVIIFQTLMCHNYNQRSAAKFNYVGLMNISTNISTTLQMPKSYPIIMLLIMQYTGVACD